MNGDFNEKNYFKFVYSIEKKFKPFKIGGVYFVTLTTKDTSATQKIIVKE